MELNPYFVIYVSKHSPFIVIIQCTANENVIKGGKLLMVSKSERKMFSHLNVYRLSLGRNDVLGIFMGNKG